MPGNDTRIVEMQFDNKDFEKNIETSQRSLERFKEELNFEDTSRSLDQFSRAANGLSFETLANNLQKLTDKFTGLGTVSEFVLSKVRGTLEDAANQLLGFGDMMTNVQMQAGMTKYELLNKSVQTIKNATGDAEETVYGVMEKLNRYTDQTSYDFADMANNIAKFTSVGIDLKTSEKAMEGIANWAAKSGQGINEASRAMYNISQAMGVGSMKLIDWKSIQNANMATKEFKEQAMEAAVATGDLIKKENKFFTNSKKHGKETEVTYKNFQETLNKGWFTNEVMLTVLGKYADTTNELGKSAYEAAQKCLTFTDALNAWKDMLSTGWMQSYQIIFGRLTDAMNLFSGMCDKVSTALDGLVQMRLSVLKAWNFQGGQDALWGMLLGELELPDGTKLYEGAYGVLDIVTKVGEMINDGFWEIIRSTLPGGVTGLMANALWDQDEDFKTWYLGDRIATITKSVQDFVKSIRDYFGEVDKASGLTRFEKIQNVINAVFFALKFGVDVIGGIFHFFSLIKQQLQPSIDAIMTFFNALGLGVREGVEEASRADSINSFFEKLATTLKPLTDGLNTVITGVSDLLVKFIAWGKESGFFAAIWQTISDVIVLIGDIVSKVSNPILEFFGSLADVIKLFFEEGITKDSMTKAGEMLETAIGNMINGIFDLIPGIGSQIQSFFAYIFGFTEDAGKEGSDTLLGALKSWLRKIFGGIGGIVEEFQDGKHPTLFGILKRYLQIGGVQKLINNFAALTKSTNLYKITMAFMGGFALIKLLRVLGQAKGMLKGAKGFFEGLSDTLKGNIKLKVGDELESTGDKFLKIAQGVALLAGAVAVLGSMKITSLAKGLAALAAVMALMVGFVYLMKTKFMSGFKESMSLAANIGALGLSVAAIAISLAILINSLKPLAGMNIYQIMSMLTGLFGVITIIGLFSTYVGKVKMKGMRQVAALAFSVGILIMALLPLANMQIDQIFTMLVTLGGIMALLVLFSHEFGSVKGKGLGSLIGLALGVGILVFALLPLANMQPDQIFTMLLSLMSILGILKLFADALNGTKSVKLTGVLGLAIGIGIMIQALMPMASLNIKQLIKVLGSLGVILFMLSVFNNGVGSMRISEMAGVIAMAAGMWILVQALLPLANLSPAQLIKMGASVVVLGVVVTAMMKTLNMSRASNIAGGVGALLSLIGLSALMLTFGFAMSAVADCRWDQIIFACAGFSMVLIVFGAIQKHMLSNSDIFDAIHSLIAMIGLAAVMFMFSAALNEMRDIDTGKIMGFAAGLSVVLVSFAIALKLLQGSSIGSGLIAIGLLAGAFAAIMGVIALMVPVVMGAIGNSLPALAARLKLMSGMIADFVGNMNQIGEGDIDSAIKKIGKLYDLITSLKDMSGYYGAVESFAECLLLLGAGVSLFNFGTQGTGEDPENIPAIKLMEKLISMQEGISSFTIGNAAGAMLSLGAGLSLFNYATKDITTDDPMALSLLNGLTDNADKIKKFNELPLETFKQQVAGLGGAMSLYAQGAQEMTGLETGEVPDVTGAVRILNAITTALNENGGFTIPDIPDEGSLTSFGTDMATLALSLQKFANASTDLGESSGFALATLDFLTGIKERLTADKLAVITAFGTDITEGTITQFGTDIGALAIALGDFADKCTGVTEDRIKTALDALDFFADLKEKLLVGDILKSVIGMFDSQSVSESDLSSFGTQIGALGTALGTFAQNVDFDKGRSANFDKAISSLDYLVALQTKMPEVGGLKQFLEGYKKDFTALAGDLESLGGGLSDLSTKVSGEGFNYEAVTSTFDALASMTEIMANLSNIPEGKLQNGMSYANLLANFTSDITNGFVGLDSTEYKPVVDDIVLFASAISDAVKEFADDGDAIDFSAIDMFKNVADGIASLVNVDTSLDFTVVGKQVAAGIAMGIRQGTIDVTEAAREIIRQAKGAAESEAEIASPSKVFAVIGGYLSQGLASGMQNDKRSVTNSAVEMMQNAIDSATGTMDLISSIMSQEVDANPTITPVLDLSSVRSGANYINGVLGGNHIIPISDGTAQRYASTSIPKTNMTTAEYQGQDLSWIQNSLADLGTRITEMGNQMQNLKIVMNTGALVGSISGDMSSELGKRTIYGRRRN